MRSDSESPYKTWKLKSLEKQTIENQEINVKFCLNKLLGAGGYAGVYLADEFKQDRFIRPVAVKLIDPARDSRQERQQEQELRTSLELKHPHVLQFFYTGKCQLEENVHQDDGQYRNKTSEYLYLVMELAEKTLAQHRQERGGILSEEDTWNVVESLASALVYFSERSPQLVHRDLKPENVLWVGNCWKISDFGIVRDTGITTTLVGTPEYAPAEAYGGNVPCAWDVWSLGITILEMVTGTRLYAKKEPQLQSELDHIFSQLSSSFNQDIIQIIKDCLHEKPEARLTAEQLEVKFIIRRLVWKAWNPETETEKAQTEKAIQTVKDFRPKLKGKTNAPNIMLRYILKWTRFQDPLLTQLLEWVCDAKSIPVEGEEQWIDQLVISHIKDWKAQKLAEYLDFDAASNSFWLGLKQKYDNPFALVDDFLARQDFPDLGTIQKISNIIDYYSASISDKNSAEGQTNFQRLISDSLNGKFSEAKKKIDQLLRRYITQGTAQKLAEYLDFDAPANSFWLGLKKKYGNPFALVDDFLAKQNWGDEEKIKKINEIIDEYKLAHYNIDGATKGEVNFQRLISDSLNYKFDEAQKTMPQAELDQLLNSIVEDSAEIEAIAIITLTKSGGIEYNNKKLKSSKPEIYQALFGRRDASDAIAEFDKLPGIPKAFNTFGEVTSYGTLEYAMFYMTQGLVIVYFIDDLPNIPVGICFISTQEANFAPFCRQCRSKIEELKEKVKGALQEV